MTDESPTKRALLELQKQPGNDKCADCGRTGTVFFDYSNIVIIQLCDNKSKLLYVPFCTQRSTSGDTLLVCWAYHVCFSLKFYKSVFSSHKDNLQTNKRINLILFQ